MGWKGDRYDVGELPFYVCIVSFLEYLCDIDRRCFAWNEQVESSACGRSRRTPSALLSWVDAKLWRSLDSLPMKPRAGGLSALDQSLACMRLPWHVSPARLQYKTPHGLRCMFDFFVPFLQCEEQNFHPTPTISQESDPPASAGDNGGSKVTLLAAPTCQGWLLETLRGAAGWVL